MWDGHGDGRERHLAPPLAARPPLGKKALSATESGNGMVTGQAFPKHFEQESLRI